MRWHGPFQCARWRAFSSQALQPQTAKRSHRWARKRSFSTVALVAELGAVAASNATTSEHGMSGKLNVARDELRAYPNFHCSVVD
jgi:hypothetical protein